MEALRGFVGHQIEQLERLYQGQGGLTEWDGGRLDALRDVEQLIQAQPEPLRIVKAGDIILDSRGVAVGVALAPEPAPHQQTWLEHFGGRRS